MCSSDLPILTAQGQEFVELICVEMPEVRFEDILICKVGGKGSSQEASLNLLDERFIQVCEKNSIVPVSAVPSAPALVGVKVTYNTVIIDVQGDYLKDHEIEVVVRVSGIRKGRLNKRFANHTYEEMVKNNRFWDKWKED